MAVLLPVLPLVATLIKLESPGPVFRKELMVGLERRSGGPKASGARRIHDARGRLFRLRSFRVTRAGESRRTRVGTLLAWSGLDRLPHLLCVLSGCMSLVGPRALSPDFLAEVHKRWPAAGRRIGGVKPGLVGYASRAPERGAGERGAFFTRLADRLFLDSVYCDQLESCTGWDVLLLDLSVLARCLVPRSLRCGVLPVRIEYPARFSAVPLQPDALEAGLLAMQDARSESADQGLTVSWMGATRPRVGWPELDESALEEICDEVLVEELRLQVAFQLEPTHSVGTDHIRVEFPVSPGELGKACEHLAPVWDALASRSLAPGFTDRVHAALLEGLSLVASRAQRDADRLLVQAEVQPDRLSLSFESVPSMRPSTISQPPRPAASAS